MKFCKTCGSELMDDDMFCSNCGTVCESETSNENEFEDVAKEKNNHKKGIIAIIIAIVVVIAVILSVVLIKISTKNSNHSEVTITEQTVNNTQSTEQENGDVSKDGRKVNIISVKGNGMTSDDAKISYDGYNKEVNDKDGTSYITASGLCIYGSLKYDDETFLNGFEGHGGTIYDGNGKELEWKDITNHKNESENSGFSNYDLSFYSDPYEKLFCVGIPDDITPGTYTVEIYQFFGDKDTSLEIEIEVK